ncbi:MAG: 4-hydroxy-tetrahydrodipicolinate synthase [Waddliaceae bacterium]
MEQPRLVTALITPFLHGQVDIEGLKTHIAYQIDNGVEGILVLGTTGESPTLTREERKVVIASAVDAVNKRVPVFVGTGTNATQSTIELTNEAHDLGADAALVVTPYYNCPMQEGIYEHFAALSRAANIPICIYNIPKRAACTMTVETVLKIAQLPRIIGIKQSSGDLNQAASLMHGISSQREQFMLWSGEDTLILPMMALGGGGVISVASNLVPGEMRTIVDAASVGDFHAARQDFFALLPLLNALCLETNPIPIKAAMDICAMPSGPCRSPLGSMSEENRRRLRETLNACGIVSLQVRS